MKITIALLKELYQNDAVFLTQHVIERCKQRGIRPIQIRNAVISGEIIEDYPEDYPFPSCLILGFLKPMFLCMSLLVVTGKLLK